MPDAPSGAVHLAAGSVAALAGGPPVALSPGEQERLNGFSQPGRGRQFLAGRALARGLLEAVFGPGSRGWSLSARAGEAPRVGGGPPLCLSLAHSGDQVVCALAEAPVGVDVERLRERRDIGGLVALACTVAERMQLAGLPPDARLAHFHVLWSLKEAWFKSAAPAGAGLVELLGVESLPCPAATANGWTWQQADAVLALVAPPGSTPLWHGPAPGMPPRRWRSVPTGGQRPG